MNLWNLCTLWFLALGACSVCIVHDTTAYTGVRVFQQYKWSKGGSKSGSKSWLKGGNSRRGLAKAGYLIVKCVSGKLAYQEVVQVENLFSQVVCPTETDCFKFARRSRYLGRDNWMSQSKIVGGLYQRVKIDDEPEYDYEWHAISPIISDFRSKWVVTRQNHTTIMQQSLVRTPCKLEKSYPRSNRWTQHVDINERYYNM